MRRKQRSLAFSAGSIVVISIISALVFPYIEPPGKRSASGAVAKNSVLDPTQQPALAPPRRAGDAPPIDAPLSDTLEQLVALANAGSAPAACRVAAELTLCSRVGERMLHHERWLSERKRALSLSTSPTRPDSYRAFGEAFKHELGRRESSLIRLVEHCASAPESTSQQRLGWWRRAAMMGDRNAGITYAVGAAFPGDAIVELAPELAIYRMEAERILLGLVRSGDLQATILLAHAYSPVAVPHGLLPQVVAKSPTMAHALYSRALAALSASNSNSAVHLRTEIAFELEQLELAMDELELAEARRQASEQEKDWGAVKPEIYPQMSATGFLGPPPPRACTQNDPVVAD